MKLFTFMTTPALAGTKFSEPSWAVWRIIARLIDGDAHCLTPDEQTIALKLLGRRKLPTQPPHTIYIGAGRRSGKSRFCSLVSVWLVAQTYSQLAPGESAVCAHIAPDREQSGIDLNYARGMANASPVLRAELTGDRASTLEFAHRTELQVLTGNYRAVRGRTLCGAVVDEAAFLRSEDTASPDIELVRALKPALLTLNGLLLVISSPHRKVGLLFNAHQKYFGNDASDRCLYIQAESRELNPSLSEARIAEDIADDPTASASEYLGLFRDDLAGFLDDAVVDAAIVPGRFALPRIAGVQYKAFCDPSGGRADSFTLAVAHSERSGKCVLDAVECITPPFDPESAVQQCAQTLARYGLSRIRGDRYAGEWCPATFRKYSITYEASELTKSQLYLECLPLFMRGAVELLDLPPLRTQLLLLERRARTAQCDAVDHPRGGHDDVANACAGALQLCAPTGGLEVWCRLGRAFEREQSEARAAASAADLTPPPPTAITQGAAQQPTPLLRGLDAAMGWSPPVQGGVDFGAIDAARAAERARAARELQESIERDNERQRAAQRERARREALEEVV